MSKRADIQGLRMVAVLMIFATHLWGWPPGGSVGVDVFFVISGFFVTRNLLKNAETRGSLSFAEFYRSRVRRIIPAATVVLILTYVVSVLISLPIRSRQVGVDAIAAFFGVSNWWFGYLGTDHFRIATSRVSPVQHFWSLSIAEQLYLVWPGLIFAIGFVAVRNRWARAHRVRFAGYATTGVVMASLAWALYESVTSPALAYLNTLSRVWELGVGSILATAVGVLAGMPDRIRPVLSWAGLGVIAVSLFFVNNDTGGFPMPWALLPVTGAGLVVTAGVGKWPHYQPLLLNPISEYLGDISYSLYLVHWPVIVILRALMGSGIYLYVAAIAASLALAVASYHFVENPLRTTNWATWRALRRDISRGRYRPKRSTGYAAVCVLTLLIVASVAYEVRPAAYEGATPSPPAENGPVNTGQSSLQPALPPLAEALQTKILAALRADTWPQLNPPMDAVLGGYIFAPGIGGCEKDGNVPPPLRCQWGSSTALVRVVLVGDSIALGYAEALRDIAENSGGRINFHSMAVGSCTFADDLIERPGLADDCQAKKQQAVDYIKATRPDIVLCADLYQPSRIVGTTQYLTPDRYADSLRREIEKFRGSATKFALLAPPAGNADIKVCFSRPASVPADCIGRVPKVWKDYAAAEQKLARQLGGAWIDSRFWFCSIGGLCPAFVGATPTKSDSAHMAPQYGGKIYPVIEESLRNAGLL